MEVLVRAFQFVNDFFTRPITIGTITFNLWGVLLCTGCIGLIYKVIRTCLRADTR